MFLSKFNNSKSEHELGQMFSKFNMNFVKMFDDSNVTEISMRAPMSSAPTRRRHLQRSVSSPSGGILLVSIIERYNRPTRD
jgi:hypothetical protein